MNCETEQAILRAGAAANPEWRRQAMRAITRLAKTGDDFTADDVWVLVKAQTHEPRALGAMLKAAAAQGLIRNTGRVGQTTRVSGHHHWQTVWVGA